MAVVICCALSISGCSQAHNLTSEVKTKPTPSGYLQVTVSPAEVHANRGDHIEIRCTILCLINTMVDVTSVDAVMFDSSDSLIRERAMTMDSAWSAGTVYTIAGDEAYYRPRVNFHIVNAEKGYPEYTADTFPITVSQS